jgi:predicted ATPase
MLNNDAQQSVQVSAYVMGEYVMDAMDFRESVFSRVLPRVSRQLLEVVIGAFVATGHALSRALCLVLLAEAAGYASQVAEGLHFLAEALAAFEASGQGDLRAEAYRLQGELLSRQADADAAQTEACFQQALAVARRQQAKSWELRAAMSLSRLWQQQGKGDEAHQLLAPIYGWFTEGFGTANLQEAKALLQELP